MTARAVVFSLGGWIVASFVVGSLFGRLLKRRNAVPPPRPFTATVEELSRLSLIAEFPEHALRLPRPEPGPRTVTIIAPSGHRGVGRLYRDSWLADFEDDDLYRPPPLATRWSWLS